MTHIHRSIHREHAHVEHRAHHGVHTMKYKAISKSHKYEIIGKVKTDHAKERIKDVASELLKVLEHAKHITEKKLKHAFKKALHHNHDLKHFAVYIHKRHH